MSSAQALNGEQRDPRNRHIEQFARGRGELTGGGDCPGLNAVIRSVVHRALTGHGDEQEKMTVTYRVTSGGVSRDVTELRRLQEGIAAMALRDPLTGLANRHLLHELLEAATEQLATIAKRKGGAKGGASRASTC